MKKLVFILTLVAFALGTIAPEINAAGGSKPGPSFSGVRVIHAKQKKHKKPKKHGKRHKTHKKLLRTK